LEMKGFAEAVRYDQLPFGRDSCSTHPESLTRLTTSFNSFLKDPPRICTLSDKIRNEVSSEGEEADFRGILWIVAPPSHVGGYCHCPGYDLMSRAWKAAAPIRKVVRLNASKTSSEPITRSQGTGSAKIKSQARKW